MCREYVEEKKELLRALAKDRKLSDLPVIPQVSSIQLKGVVFSPDSTSSSRSLLRGSKPSSLLYGVGNDTTKHYQLGNFITLKAITT